MTVTNDKLLLFRSHSGSHGLDDAAVEEIADAAELIQLDPGEILQRAGEPVDSVFLIVHGRLKQSVVDMHGSVLVHRTLKRGSQFGLVDGGLVDNVPADVLLRRGCNFVIAVSVTSALEPEFARNNSSTPIAKMRSASMLQTVLRSYLVQHVNMNSVGVEPADFVIEPDVAGIDLSDFSRTRDLAAVGQRTALDAMAPLTSLLSKLDDRLFPTT